MASDAVGNIAGLVVIESGRFECRSVVTAVAIVCRGDMASIFACGTWCACVTSEAIADEIAMIRFGVGHPS